MIKDTGSINLSYSSGRPRTVRTKEGAQRILREDLGCFPYKKIKQPKLTDLHKMKRAKFANWVLNHYTKEDTEKWLFTGEKYFDLDGVYNVQNDRVWAVSREEADGQCAIHQKIKFPTKVMVWFGVCSEGLTTPMIFEDGTMDAEMYIKEVLSVAPKCGNNTLGNHWTYQQDGVKLHIHYLTQEWCTNPDHFPDFISQDR
ncbi:unnamed protein product [Rotaria magnacalcarata]|nr:unnamed protein product [Rotaria magnacalcarata]CAF3802431.1 unnamed protein product [Rotaria magnacalcarata]